MAKNVSRTVPGTREWPDETRLANDMRRRRNIPRFLLQLNEKGRPVKINIYPSSIPDTCRPYHFLLYLALHSIEIELFQYFLDEDLPKPSRSRSPKRMPIRGSRQARWLAGMPLSPSQPSRSQSKGTEIKINVFT